MSSLAINNNNDAMLASSMMLVSISEETAHDIGYKSHLCSSSSSLSGWGSAATRQSCKVDLCSLAAQASQPMAMQQAPVMMSSADQGWGFFEADGFCQQR